MSDWDLQAKQRRMLRMKLDMAMQADSRLALESILFRGGAAHIWRFKVKGHIQLRPRLCLGPVDEQGEMTMLQRAKEVGGKEKPPNPTDRAVAKRLEVIEDPDNRRRKMPEAGL